MTLFRALREQADIPTQRTSRLRLSPSPAAQQAIHTGHYGEYMAQFRGALLQLFGEPYTVDSDADYIYVIEARDSAGARWILKVVEGSSGPSMRGDNRDATLIPIVEELRTLIETTPPADFEAIHSGSDSPAQVVYGCRNGVCYWRET
jgi:hypothetical protein